MSIRWDIVCECLRFQFGVRFAFRKQIQLTKRMWTITKKYCVHGITTKNVKWPCERKNWSKFIPLRRLQRFFCRLQRTVQLSIQWRFMCVQICEKCLFIYIKKNRTMAIICNVKCLLSCSMHLSFKCCIDPISPRRLFLNTNAFIFHCVSKNKRNSIIHNFIVIVLNDGNSDNADTHSLAILYPDKCPIVNVSNFQNVKLASLSTIYIWWRGWTIQAEQTTRQPQASAQLAGIHEQVSCNKLKCCMCVCFLTSHFQIESLFTADHLWCHFLIVHAILAQNLLFADGFEKCFFDQVPMAHKNNKRYTIRQNHTIEEESRCHSLMDATKTYS